MAGTSAATSIGSDSGGTSTGDDWVAGTSAATSIGADSGGTSSTGDDWVAGTSAAISIGADSGGHFHWRHGGRNFCLRGSFEGWGPIR